MSENKELKPCPFCGSPAEHISKQNVEIISCTLCDMGRAYEGSGAALIAMWNTRQSSDLLDEAVELLKESLDISNNGGPMYRGSIHRNKIRSFLLKLTEEKS